MTKKNKQKAKSASGSPSGSACSESSVSRSSAPPSSEMVGEVVSDLSDPSSPGAVTATKAAAEDPLFAVNGAVTATESVGAHGNPNSEIEGAVTATLEEGEFVRPPIVTPATIPIVHAEAITNFVGAHENPSSEIEGAVTATVEDGELVPPPSVTPATTLIVPEGKAPITDAEQSSSPQICDATTGSDIAKMAANHWRQFFYEEPPARGAVHAIVNGIWSKNRRDISVSKMEGHAFLFWPDPSTVPVWLEFTGVPLQFFNKDALKEIAGLVGYPICLHPSTENLTNIEVAKVYTVIDPRKPLPGAVGHTLSKCPTAPRCEVCNSVKHSSDICTRARNGLRPGKAPIKSQLPIVDIPAPSHSTVAPTGPPKEPSSASKKQQRAVKNNTDRVLQIQEAPGPSAPPPRKDFLVVDLNAAGLSSPRNSAYGSDSDYDSGSDSISADDDNPPTESDRFVEVPTTIVSFKLLDCYWFSEIMF
ncbi:unnamed protein product [Brassica oleracea]